MQEPRQYIYIDGVPFLEVPGWCWTVTAIEATYQTLVQNGALPFKEGKHHPTWYPLNNMGFPNYSLSKGGELLSNYAQKTSRGTLDVDGYFYFSLALPGQKAETSTIRADRLVAAFFLPPPPTPSSLLRPINGNPADSSISNLHWVSKQMTMAAVIQIRPDGSEVLWPSIKEASQALRLTAGQQSGISKAIRTGKTAAGSHWKHYNQKSLKEKWQEMSELTYRNSESQAFLVLDRIKNYKTAQPKNQDEESPYEPFSISNCGRIKDKKGRIGFGIPDGRGYLIYHIKEKLKEGATKRRSIQVRVDELVIRAFYHKNFSPDVFLILHKDDNVTNNHIGNLDVFLEDHFLEAIYKYRCINQARIYGITFSIADTNTKDGRQQIFYTWILPMSKGKTQSGIFDPKTIDKMIEDSRPNSEEEEGGRRN